MKTYAQQNGQTAYMVQGVPFPSRGEYIDARRRDRRRQYEESMRRPLGDAQPYGKVKAGRS